MDSARLTFVLGLAVAMSRAGTGTAQLEETLGRVARGLGLDATFLAVPTAVWAAVREGGVEHTRMLPVEGAETDLTRLEALRALSRAVEAGTLDVDTAQLQLDAITRRPPRWRSAAQCAAFATVSGPAAALFGGGVEEVVAAALAGLVAGVLAVRGGALGIGPLAPALSAAAVMGVASAMSRLTGGLAADVVVLSGLIVLVPGFTIHRGMTDLSTGHLISGTARVAQALTMLLLMGFGVALASQVGGPALTAPAPGAPLWLKTLAITATTPGLLVLFQAPLRGVGVAIVSGMVAWFGGLLGAQLVGPELGAFVAAIGVGLFAHGFERWTDRPAALALVPGLMLLVPGTVGFRTVSALLDGRPMVAVETGFAVLMTSVSLVAGLLAASVISGLVRPRGSLAPPPRFADLPVPRSLQGIRGGRPP